MTKGPVYIEDTNLSRAWARAFQALTEPGVEEIVPLVLTVSGLDNGTITEDPSIRASLETALEAAGHQSCQTVANTIFPSSLWNSSTRAEVLYDRYRRILPRLRARHQGNHYGLYFARMIAFIPKGEEQEEVNQLKHILETRSRGNPRRSALQLVVFDPTRDHTHQRQRGFPCLQQVAFAPFGPRKTQLSMTAFYATQYLFERAYGNYLGLCELGRFVAHELGIQLTQLTCVAAIAQLGKTTSGEARKLSRKLNVILEPCPTGRS